MARLLAPLTPLTAPSPGSAQVDLMTRESVLRVAAVTDSDYGDYTCSAASRLGADSGPVRLAAPSVPDPPLQLRVLNVSSRAVTLAWTPAFDGGFTQVSSEAAAEAFIERSGVSIDLPSMVKC